MIQTIYSDPNSLSHHGIKGMHWGVRKQEESLDSKYHIGTGVGRLSTDITNRKRQKAEKTYNKVYKNSKRRGLSEETSRALADSWAKQDLAVSKDAYYKQKKITSRLNNVGVRERAINRQEQKLQWAKNDVEKILKKYGEKSIYNL